MPVVKCCLLHYIPSPGHHTFEEIECPPIMLTTYVILLPHIFSNFSSYPISCWSFRHMESLVKKQPCDTDWVDVRQLCCQAVDSIIRYHVAFRFLCMTEKSCASYSLLSAFSLTPPSVMWAQRADKVYLTINLEDCKSPDIKIDEEKLFFR